MHKKRFKTRFYVILALLLTLLVVLGVFLASRGGAELTMGVVSMELPVSCVVIRDEASVSAERYSRILHLVGEGAPVEESTPVAQVYKWGYSDDMTQTLLNIQRDIYQEQLLQTEGIANPELDSLQLQIDQKQAAIRACVMGGSDEDVLTLSNELNALLTQRTEHLKTNVQMTEALNALYTLELERLTQLSDYWTEATASGSGLVSFYFDGYEQVLSADKLGMLNAEVIRSVVRAGATVSAALENQIYRLVNPEHWYVAFVTPTTDAVRLAAGEVYTVSFAGYAETLVSGTALAPVASESGVLNIIEFHTGIGEFLSLRNLSGTITCTMTGLRVPLSAVTVKDGVPGVTVEQGGGETARVDVEVLASDGAFAVVRAVPGQTLAAGQRYVDK